MTKVTTGTDLRVLALMFPPGTGLSTSKALRLLKERRKWLTLAWFMVVVMWCRYVAMRSWLVSISSCDACEMFPRGYLVVRFYSLAFIFCM